MSESFGLENNSQKRKKKLEKRVTTITRNNKVKIFELQIFSFLKESSILKTQILLQYLMWLFTKKL